jgi:hypothetical protein
VSASARWRKEQAEAVRRSRPKSQPAAFLPRPDAGLLSLMASSPADFQAIGTHEGMHLLADSLTDVERLLANDHATRETLVLLLKEEIGRFEDLQRRLGAQS